MKLKLYILLIFLIGFEVAIAQSINNNPQTEISMKKSHQMDISIYPNPTVDVFNINSGEPVGKVEIFNIIGKKIKVLKNIHSNSFDVSDLRNGIYLVRIFNKHNKVLKVIRLGKNDQLP